MIEEKMRSKSIWFISLGFPLIFLGAFAFSNVFLATTFSVFYIGIAMMIAGLAQVMHSFQVKGWPVFLYLLASGVLYGAAGFVTFRDPFLAATVITLALIFALVLSGASRIWSSFRMKHEAGWGWFLASGIATVGAGFIFMIGWPSVSLWMLGMILAVDLTIQGIAYISVGALLWQGQFKSVAMPGLKPFKVH